jgi:hypothetical protein
MQGITGKKEEALNKMFLQRQGSPTSEREPVAK